jgi:hypothetical protein
MYASRVTLNPPSVYNDAVVVKPVGLNDEEKYCPPSNVFEPVVAYDPVLEAKAPTPTIAAVAVEETQFTFASFDDV